MTLKGDTRHSQENTGHLFLDTGYYNPGQNSWDIKAMTGVKVTHFLPPPPSDAMLMSGIQVIFGRLNIAWGKGGKKKWFTKTTLPTFFKRWIQSLI